MHIKTRTAFLSLNEAIVEKNTKKIVQKWEDSCTKWLPQLVLELPKAFDSHQGFVKLLTILLQNFCYRSTLEKTSIQGQLSSKKIKHTQFWIFFLFRRISSLGKNGEPDGI